MSEREQLNLLATEAHARRTDPGTSHAAARSIPPEKLRESQKAVLNCLRREGPMTDEELGLWYVMNNVIPWQSPSGLRTRRHELEQGGYIEDSGKRHKLTSGRLAIVWKVRDA